MLQFDALPVAVPEGDNLLPKMTSALNKTLKDHKVAVSDVRSILRAPGHGLMVFFVREVAEKVEGVAE